MSERRVSPAACVSSYYWVNADEQILFLTIYGKSEKADLSAADLKRVVRMLEELTND